MAKRQTAAAKASKAKAAAKAKEASALARALAKVQAEQVTGKDTMTNKAITSTRHKNKM